MIKLEETLARLGAAHLARLLGEPTVRLLEALDLKNLSNTRLANLIIQRSSPEILLHTKDIRVAILSALRLEEAKYLTRLLQLSEAAEPYSSLTELNFRRGSTNSNLLFTFFGYEPPETDRDEELPPSESVINAQYPLFDHQRRACCEVINQVISGIPPRVLLHMPTGSGKTRTAMNIISHILRYQAEDDQVVVWLAHSEELCEQAAEEFKNCWAIIGDRKVTLFRHFGPYRVNDLGQVSGGLLIGGLQLLYQHSLTYSSSFFGLARRARLVVMDEAHHATAPTYAHLLNLLAPGDKTAILGLSATPGRSLLNPGEDIKLADFFARKKVTLQVPGYSNPVEFLDHEGYLAKVEYVYLSHSPGDDFKLTSTEIEILQAGFDLPDRVIKSLAEDHIRNMLVITRVILEADQDGRIIVFACSVDHANMIADILRIKGYRAAAITSKTPAQTRRRIIAQYRDGDEIQILTNFGVLTSGFDAPKTNVAVITRPTRSVVLYSQMIGRATRGPRAGGNANCRVITVVDRIPGFRSVAEAFTFWEDIWTN